MTIAPHPKKAIVKFSGEVEWVQIDLEKDDPDHLITPEERFKVAMARQ